MAHAMVNITPYCHGPLYAGHPGLQAPALLFLDGPGKPGHDIEFYRRDAES
jgi:hypothetical protein